MRQTAQSPAAHWLKILLVPFIALPALVMALTLVTWAAESRDFGHPTNLSASHSLISGAPAMAAAGNTLAVAWVEELSGTTLPVGNQGSLYLQTAQTYWPIRVTVHTGTVNALATDPALIFDRSNPAQMHLVWTEGRLEVSGSSNRYFYQKINYTTCTISGDVKACQPAANITATTNTGLSFRNPTLAQDDQGNLHVVWTEERNSQLYYRRWDKAGGLWGPSSLISQASDAQNPKLAYANGRLHLIWDNKATNQINYIYDGQPANDVFTADDAWQFIPGDNFTNGNPGNATLTTDNNNYVFVAFDIRKPNTNNAFALVYVQSENNGSSWTSPRDIPDQSDGNFYSYPSNTENVTGGLKPSLALTATGGITYLHVVWHTNQERDSGDNAVYEIYHAYRPVSDDTFNTPWLPATPLNVTNPPGAATGTPEDPVTPTPVTPTPSMREPVAPDNFRITGLTENDSVMPALAITDPAGKGNLHLAYLERLSANQPWNVYYRGFIAGTIDPEYIKNTENFDIAKKVDQTAFFTANPIGPLTLNYNITITNSGVLTAVGLGITDTFISGLNYIDNINTLVATIGPAGGSKVALNPAPALNGNAFTWRGDVPAGHVVNISFRAFTKIITPTRFIRNRVQMWNSGSMGQPIERAEPPFKNIATTAVTQYRVMLPLISKK